MLGPQDLKQVASLMGNVQNTMESEALPTLNGSESYEVEHLDYAYINKCCDLSELSLLLRVLRSGKEGYYPDLEQAIVDRMETVNPELKKNAPLTPLQKYELEKSVASELKNWDQSIQDRFIPVETKSKAVKLVNRYEPEPELFEESTSSSSAPSTVPIRGPPIRGSAKTASITVHHTSPEKDPSKTTDDELRPLMTAKNPNRIRSGDYRAWDQFDVDSELARLEESQSASQSKDVTQDRTIVMKHDEFHSRITAGLEPERLALLSKVERGVLADRERVKGNECFKATEYDDALIHYSRSLRLVDENPLLLNNRSAVHLKRGEYEKAENDSTRSIAACLKRRDAGCDMNESASTFAMSDGKDVSLSQALQKAYYRRGLARYYRGRYLAALSDFEACHKLEKEGAGPEKTVVSEATQWIQNCKEKFLEVEGDRANRILADSSVSKGVPSTAGKLKRMTIQEAKNDIGQVQEGRRSSMDPQIVHASQESSSQQDDRASILERPTPASGPKVIQIREVEGDEHDEDDDDATISTPPAESSGPKIIQIREVDDDEDDEDDDNITVTTASEIVGPAPIVHSTHVTTPFDSADSYPAGISQLDVPLPEESIEDLEEIITPGAARLNETTQKFSKVTIRQSDQDSDDDE